MSGILRGGLKTPVGYIPCGTTNDFASTLGLPKKIMKAAKNVISGRVMQQDIGLFNDSRYFTYIASFGAFTRASYATPQRAKNIWGHLAYVMQGLHDVGDIKPFEVTVTHDGITESGSYIFGSVTNSTSVGGVMKLSTDTVNVRDGLFELMLVKTPTNPSKIGKMLNDVVTQQYDGNPVSLFHCSHFRFESKTPLSWTIDGEAGGEHALTTLECLHGAVNIIVP